VNAKSSKLSDDMNAEVKELVDQLLGSGKAFLKEAASSLQRYLQLYLAGQINADEYKALVEGVKMSLEIQARLEGVRLRKKILGWVDRIASVYLKDILKG